MFIRHRRLVIEMLDAAIGLLENDDLHTLIGVLKDLGRRHVIYGVLPPHYSVVGEALIHTLGAALGDKFTPSLMTAWLDVWGVISSAMIEGAEGTKMVASETRNGNVTGTNNALCEA
jgi:hemoglobin-like flavoprotein